MSYNITLTNGTLLTTVADATVDISTTSLSLIGKNTTGFGTNLNNNFVRMLENSSSTNAPAKPLVGQLWWDGNTNSLKIWQGTLWKVLSNSQSGATAPLTPNRGDFWWNTGTTQLMVFDGANWIGIGPAVLPGAAITSIGAYTVTDNLTVTHVVGNVTVNNKLSAVFSVDTGPFNPVPAMAGMTVINPGLNLSTGLTVTGNTIASNVQATSVQTTNLVASAANISTINGGAATFSGNVAFTGNISWPASQNLNLGSLTTSLVPSANLSYNLGSSVNWWNNIYGTSIHAQYADLAERFEADVVYEPGTVVELGGAAEITAAIAELSEDVFGVISTNAAFVMNSRAGNDETHPPVAVQGRVPVKVVGKVRKGDRLVSAGNGYARAGARSEITTWNVIGRSLENKTTAEPGVVEAVVKLNS